MNVEKNGLVRILLVDDDEDCRLLIRDAISHGRIGNEVYEVGSGEEALDFLHHRGQHRDSPDIGLVYLDIEMPGMSGQDLLKVLRANESFQDVPIVMMTNLKDDREKEAAAQAGANSYTIKPTDPVEFMRSVIETTKYWIGIHQHPARLMREAEPAGVAGGAPS